MHSKGFNVDYGTKSEIPLESIRKDMIYKVFNNYKYSVKSDLAGNVEYTLIDPYMVKNNDTELFNSTGA